jgi:hypothetical protein
MWRLEIIRKHSQIILIIYKDKEEDSEDDFDYTLTEESNPRGQIIVDDEEDIDKWKDAIMKLNSLS